MSRFRIFPAFVFLSLISQAAPVPATVQILRPRDEARRISALTWRGQAWAVERRQFDGTEFEVVSPVGQTQDAQMNVLYRGQKLKLSKSGLFQLRVRLEGELTPVELTVIDSEGQIRTETLVLRRREHAGLATPIPAAIN